MIYYYQVKGGPLLKRLSKYRDRKAAADNAHREWAIKQGAVEMNGPGLLKFPGKPPKGWVKSKRFPGFYHASGSIPGKKIVIELNQLPPSVGHMDLYCAITGEVTSINMDRYRRLSPGLQWRYRAGIHYLAVDPALIKLSCWSGLQEIPASLFEGRSRLT